MKPLYDEAIAIITAKRQVSTKLLQDNLLIGYNRAHGIICQMERDRIVSQKNKYGVRVVLI